jgi:hypothetical protein
VGEAERGRREFQQALPWYVGGTLDDERRRRVEAYLLAHPDADDELRWHIRMREATREAALSIAADLDWDEYARKVGLKTRGAAPSRRLRDLVAACWPADGRRVSPTLAACALSVVVAQAGVIGRLAWTSRASAVAYSGDRAEAVAVPLLHLRFRHDATEYEIRKLLLDADVRVVDGPSQLGDYSVSVSADRLEDVRRTLMASPVVELVGVNPRVECCRAR